MEEFFIDADGVRLHAKLDRPEGPTQTPLCILLHGLTGHMEERHIVAVQQAMVEVGVAVLRVELYGHGQSEGHLSGHTLYKWMDEVLTVIDWAKGLDWPTKLYLSGHSQGGYTTMHVAGLRHDDLAAIMPLSPAIVIEDGARAGEMIGMRFDPDHIPDLIYMDGAGPAEDGTHLDERRALSGDYYRIAQTLHVAEAIDHYLGPVLLVHGNQDEAVPVRYSIDSAVRYHNARLVIIEGEDHNYHHHLDRVCAAVQDFLRELGA